MNDNTSPHQPDHLPCGAAITTPGRATPVLCQQPAEHQGSHQAGGYSWPNLHSNRITGRPAAPTTTETETPPGFKDPASRVGYAAAIVVGIALTALVATAAVTGVIKLIQWVAS